MASGVAQSSESMFVSQTRFGIQQSATKFNVSFMKKTTPTHRHPDHRGGSGSQSKKFIKTPEDFTCEQCRSKVVGNGYTNHCPHCLYSKHVDIYPGDRAEKCCGLMEPIAIRSKDGKYIINHKCIKCGNLRPNKVSEQDNFDEVVRLSTRP